MEDAQYRQFRLQVAVFQHLAAGNKGTDDVVSELFRGESLATRSERQFSLKCNGASYEGSGLLPIAQQCVQSGTASVPDSQASFPNSGDASTKSTNSGKVKSKSALILAADPSPSRCNRTDGQRWRCKQTAVPNGAYCERHMCRCKERTCYLNNSVAEGHGDNEGKGGGFAKLTRGIVCRRSHLKSHASAKGGSARRKSCASSTVTTGSTSSGLVREGEPSAHGAAPPLDSSATATPAGLSSQADNGDDANATDSKANSASVNRRSASVRAVSHELATVRDPTSTESDGTGTTTSTGGGRVRPFDARRVHEKQEGSSSYSSLGPRGRATGSTQRAGGHPYLQTKGGDAAAAGGGAAMDMPPGGGEMLAPAWGSAPVHELWGRYGGAAMGAGGANTEGEANTGVVGGRGLGIVGVGAGGLGFGGVRGAAALGGSEARSLLGRVAPPFDPAAPLASSGVSAASIGLPQSGSGLLGPATPPPSVSLDSHRLMPPADLAHFGSRSVTINGVVANASLSMNGASSVSGGPNNAGMGVGVGVAMRSASRLLPPAPSADDSMDRREQLLPATSTSSLLPASSSQLLPPSPVPPLSSVVAFAPSTAAQALASFAQAGIGGMEPSGGGMNEGGGGELSHVGVVSLVSNSVQSPLSRNLNTPMPPLRDLSRSRMSLLLPTSDESDFMGGGLLSPLDALARGTQPLPQGSMALNGWPAGMASAPNSTSQSSSEGGSGNGAMGGNTLANVAGLVSLRGTEGVPLGAMADRWGHDDANEGPRASMEPWGTLQTQAAGHRLVVSPQPRAPLEARAASLLSPAPASLSPKACSLPEQDLAARGAMHASLLGGQTHLMRSAKEIAILRALAGRAKSPLPVGGLSFASPADVGGPVGAHAEARNQVTIMPRLSVASDPPQGVQVRPPLVPSLSCSPATFVDSVVARNPLPPWPRTAFSGSLVRQQGSCFHDPNPLGPMSSFSGADAHGPGFPSPLDRRLPLSALQELQAMSSQLQAPLQRLLPAPPPLPHVTRFLQQDRRSLMVPTVADGGMPLLAAQDMDCGSLTASLGGSVRLPREAVGGFASVQESGMVSEEVEGHPSQIFTDMLMFDKGMGCGVDH